MTFKNSKIVYVQFYKNIFKIAYKNDAPEGKYNFPWRKIHWLATLKVKNKEEKA